MGDISSWSPVDESNTMPPPHGWPEGQATNTVNNCGRAMQGAIRRWYDAITAQLAALTTSLGNYLPLTGGNLSGGLSATHYNLSGVAFAQRNATVNYHLLFDADGGDSLYMGGAATGHSNLYRAGTHTFQSNDGAVAFAAVSAAGLTVPAMVDTTQYKLYGATFAYRSGDGAHHIFDGGGQLALALHPGINYYRANDHVWQNDAGTTTASLGSTGAITAADIIVSGGVTAAGITSTGGISTNGGIFAAGNITGNVITGATVNSNNHMTAAGNISAAGNITSSNTVTGNAVNSNGGMVAAGTISAAHIGSHGTLVVEGGANIVGTLTVGVVSSNQGIFTNLDASDIECSGNIDTSATLGANAVNANTAAIGAVTGNTIHAYGTLSSGTSVAAPNIAASSALSSAGNCEAASYTRGGVPMALLTLAQLADIEARIEALEQARVPA